MMKRVLRACMILAGSIAVASAGVITYANNPTGNSVDFNTEAGALGSSAAYSWFEGMSGALNSKLLPACHVLIWATTRLPMEH
jgi:hypothetical protein